MQKAASKPMAIAEEDEESVDVSDPLDVDADGSPSTRPKRGGFGASRGGIGGGSSSSVVTAPTICTRFSSELESLMGELSR